MYVCKNVLNIVLHIKRCFYFEISVGNMSTFNQLKHVVLKVNKADEREYKILIVEHYFLLIKRITCTAAAITVMFMLFPWNVCSFTPT